MIIAIEHSVHGDIFGQNHTATNINDADFLPNHNISNYEGNVKHFYY